MLATAMSANVFFWIILGLHRDGADEGGRRSIRCTASAPSSAACTTPLHAAGADRDAQQPLRFPYGGSTAGWCWCTGDAGRRADPPFLRGADIKALNGRPSVALGVRIVGNPALIVVLSVAAPAPTTKSAMAAPLSWAQVQVGGRAALRHVPQRAGHQQPQLHTPELIEKNAQALYQQAVVLLAMRDEQRRRSPEERFFWAAIRSGAGFPLFTVPRHLQQRRGDPLVAFHPRRADGAGHRAGGGAAQAQSSVTLSGLFST